MNENIPNQKFQSLETMTNHQDFDREGDLSLLHVFFKDTTMIKWGRNEKLLLMMNHH